jgi:hypothetical protein
MHTRTSLRPDGGVTSGCSDIKGSTAVINLKVIRLELARTKGHPDGDPRHGYVFRAPLTKNGHIYAADFSKNRDLCSVMKFAPGTGDETGRLIRTRKGWAFSYKAGDSDDETIFRLGAHIFQPGEYVTITEHDGEPYTFRVISVEDAVLITG